MCVFFLNLLFVWFIALARLLARISRAVFAAEEEADLTVTLVRPSPLPTEGAHTPKFPKRKEEGILCEIFFFFHCIPFTARVLIIRLVPYSGRSFDWRTLRIEESKLHEETFDLQAQVC
jgi:hypothetical protein